MHLKAFGFLLLNFFSCTFASNQTNFIVYSANVLQSTLLNRLLDREACKTIKNLQTKQAVQFLCKSLHYKNYILYNGIKIEKVPNSILNDRANPPYKNPWFTYNKRIIRFEHFPRFEEIENYLLYLNETFPQFVLLKCIGLTHENRSLYMIKIGTTQTNSIVIEAGIHAREWASISSAIYVIDKLVDLFDNSSDSSDPRLQVSWNIFPLVNPDGYEYSRFRQPFWRKNRSPPTAGNNCYGVDLNRNWGTQGYGIWSSNDSCSDIYHGLAPDSELEIKAVKKILYTLKGAKGFLSLHTFGGAILTPYCYKFWPKLKFFQLHRIGQLISKFILSENRHKYELRRCFFFNSHAGGTSLDFAIKLGIPYALLIELHEINRTKFFPPSKAIAEIGNDVWIAMKVLADFCKN